MDRWKNVADAYARSFATLCAGTVDAVLEGLPAGELMDIGCGDGTLMARAEASGKRACGVDSDPDMVAFARERVRGAVCAGELPSLDLPSASIESASANFVLNHVPEPSASAEEIRRILVPGGRFAGTIWPSGGGGWAAFIGPVFKASEVVPLQGGALPPEKDFPRSVDGFAGLLTAAGLDVLETREIRWTWSVRPEDLWTGIAGGVATPGQTFVAQTPEVQARVEQQFWRRAERDVQDGNLRFSAVAVLAVAQR